jgi:hypothetical protein
MSWGRKQSGLKSIKNQPTPHFYYQLNVSLLSLSLHLRLQPPALLPSAWPSSYQLQVAARPPYVVSAPPPLSLSSVNFIFFSSSNWRWMSFSPTDSCWPSSQAISYTAPKPGNLPFSLFSSSTTCGGVAACRMIIHSACSMNYNSRDRWAGPTTTWSSDWTYFSTT